MLSEEEILTEWEWVSVSEVSKYMPKDIIRVLSAIEGGKFHYCSVKWADGVAALVHWKGDDSDTPPPNALLRAYRDPFSIAQS